MTDWADITMELPCARDEHTDLQGGMPGERACVRWKIETTPPKSSKSSIAASDRARATSTGGGTSSTGSSTAVAPATGAKSTTKSTTKTDVVPAAVTPDPPPPSSGQTDAAKGARGAKATKASAKAGNRDKPAPSTPPASSTASGNSNAAADAESRQADKLDTQLTAEQRQRLQREQDEFFKVNDTSPGDDRGGGKKGRGRVEAPPKRSDSKRRVDEPDADMDAGHPVSDKPSASTPKLPSHAKQLEFFADREHWVDPSGDVWKVEVTAEDRIVMWRNGDDNPSLNAGYPPRGPRGGKPEDGTSEGPRPLGSVADNRDAGAEMPVSQSTDGMVLIQPDGQIVNATTSTARFEDGSQELTGRRSSQGPLLQHEGIRLFRNVTATAADGTTYNVRERTSAGLYAKGPYLIDHVQEVSVTEADGSRRSTSSDRPSPRETPATLDELRELQDELGRTYAGRTSPVPDDAKMADRIAHLALETERGIDRGGIQRAVERGSAELAGADGAGATKYGELTFEQVRERFAEFGLDAAAGNELIDRDWHDTSVVSNAYYDSIQDKMVFGVMGGSGVPLAMSDDVIAHEFTHRLAEKNGAVRYEGESGAIHESLADTMAAAIDEEDWILGEDIMSGGFRDMSTPTTMNDFLKTKSDHGGVHTNSAIPNHAAYLIGDKVGRDTMGKIYAETIDEHLAPDMTFKDLATATWRSAVDLYGADSTEAGAVRGAWDAVLLLDGDDALFTTP